MDHVLVLYTCRDQDSDFPNAVSVSIPSGKELLLLDVMAALSPIIGCKYTYYGKCSLSSNAPASIVTLRSPTSVVPVLDDGCAHLILDESGAPPMVPIAQLTGFSDISRRCVALR